MKQYLDLMDDILTNGSSRGDRTGTGTLSLFGTRMEFDLKKGFPLVTTKRIHIKSVIHELLWFLRGDTNIKYLTDNGVSIWQEWATEDGEIGPMYGSQFRSWPDYDGGYIDQIEELIYGIKYRPNSRRHIVSAWNVADLPSERQSPQENVQLGRMALAPCHFASQFYVQNGQLSCQLYQRSADVFLGVPFNIASYALLTAMIAQQCDLDVGKLIWVGGDTHLYMNHLQQAQEQLKRETKPLPTLLLNKAPSINDYKFEDFQILDYDSWPAISAPIAV